MESWGYTFVKTWPKLLIVWYVFIFSEGVLKKDISSKNDLSERLDMVSLGLIWAGTYQKDCHCAVDLPSNLTRKVSFFSLEFSVSVRSLDFEEHSIHAAHLHLFVHLLQPCLLYLQFSSRDPSRLLFFHSDM
jgi:hypothetical protein